MKLPADHDGSDPLRVLIVDDNRDTAEMICQLLRKLGCECLALYHPKAALEMAPTYQADLLLIDLAMPVVDGYSLVQEWRKADNLSGAFIVAVSGYCGAEHRKQAADAGFDEFIAKPFTLAELKRVVEMAERRLET